MQAVLWPVWLITKKCTKAVLWQHSKVYKSVQFGWLSESWEQPRRHTFSPLSAGHISLSSASSSFVLEVSLSHMFSAIIPMFSAYVLAAAPAICYLHKTQNIQVSQQNIPSALSSPLSLSPSCCCQYILENSMIISALQKSPILVMVLPNKAILSIGLLCTWLLRGWAPCQLSLLLCRLWEDYHI